MKNKKEITVDGKTLWFDVNEWLHHKHYYDMLANEQLPPFLRDPQLSKDYQELLEKRKLTNPPSISTKNPK